MSGPLRVTLAVVAVAALRVVAHAGELDEAGRRQAAALEQAIAQVETNLRLALDAAGPGEGKPAPAKARLALTRLAQPKSAVAELKARLAALPADAAEVVALVARVAAAEAKIAALEARVAGGAAPAATGGAKLDYKQEQALKDARFHLREATGLVAAVETLVAEVTTVANPDAVDHRRVARGHRPAPCPAGPARRSRELARLRRRPAASPGLGASVRIGGRGLRLPPGAGGRVGAIGAGRGRGTRALRRGLPTARRAGHADGQGRRGREPVLPRAVRRLRVPPRVATRAAWARVEPDARVLAVRIPSARFERDTLWRLENRTWRFIDRSRLQVSLVVARDDRLAAVRPVNLWIDHVSGDALSAHPMDSLDDPLPPHRLLLRSKVR